MNIRGVPSQVPESSTSEAVIEPISPAELESDTADGEWGEVSRWWFAALDQRRFAVGAEHWVAQVVGIYVDGVDLWIQLESAAGTFRSLTLRVTQGTGLHEVLDAIRAMIARDLMGLPARQLQPSSQHS